MSRYYLKYGKKLPSVTTIGSLLRIQALPQWAANCACDYILDEMEKNHYYTWDKNDMLGNILSIIESARKNFRKVSAEAMDIGSAVHAAIEYYLKTGDAPRTITGKVETAFIAFLDWEKENNMQVIKTEHTLYADRYAGTCDLICYLDFDKYIIDFKASKGIYKDYLYQIAAYRATDPTIKGCGILRLDKESGLPEWKDTSDTYEQDLKVFNALVDVWYAMHPELEAQNDHRELAGGNE